MKTLAFVNIKGGVAKTTSIWNVAGELASRGLRVLLLDFDRQCNLTNIALADEKSGYIQGVSKDIYDVFIGKANFEEVACKCYITKFNKKESEYIGIDVLPGSQRVAKATIAEEYVGVKQEFEDFSQSYDYVLIDMPACHEGINDICFSDFANNIIVPFSSDIQSLEGYEILIGMLNKAREKNEELALLGIFLSKYSKNMSLDIYVKEQLSRFGTFIDIQIPAHNDVRYSTAYCQPLVFLKKKEYSYRWVTDKEKIKEHYITTGDTKVDEQGVEKEKVGVDTPLKRYRDLTEYIIEHI